MLTWNDVIDVKNERVERRWNMAVLAAVACPPPDLPD